MEHQALQNENAKSEANKGRIHLAYLDGLRGFAALYVVLHHAWLEVFWLINSGTNNLLQKATGWLQYGQAAVGVFIVLSGYCLMMPVVKTGLLSSGGIVNFIRRRAWRILPPYMAALFLSLFLLVIIPGLREHSNSVWDIALPGFDLHAIIAHLFLIHNLKQEWMYKIDYTLWSVATEWQIYFLFALILLPIYRARGIFSSLICSVLLGLGLHKVFSSGSFDFVILFGLGMFGAVVNFSEPGTNGLPKKIDIGDLPWGWLSIIFTGLLIGACLFSTRMWETRHVLFDIMSGLPAMCFLIYATNRIQKGEGHLIGPIRCMQSRYGVILGQFSYSLYLTHALVLATFHVMLSHLGTLDNLSFWCLIGLGVPLSLLFGYGFYWVFERPFLRRRDLRSAVKSPAIVSELGSSTIS